ncbi:hypothetical protein HanXRQr2_Chr03g0114641 [Helianthus annuus]|uniref:Uncharacterized protein n=1 Tax=Helianthus annuus TaxID=4232 RepID=A0A9K3JHS9_HELAN|nr:hypothetical protein HanXRQr2_Chr03g0114641 [Helianthus annuus]KAJ0943985.1 hypothetical protein HanPSC8_Chr03g0111011 [Helianthus annuus]
MYGFFDLGLLVILSVHSCNRIQINSLTTIYGSFASTNYVKDTEIDIIDAAVCVYIYIYIYIYNFI